MTIQNRIHMGVTGKAKCHATYGWFCLVISVLRERIKFRLGLWNH